MATASRSRQRPSLSARTPWLEDYPQLLASSLCGYGDLWPVPAWCQDGDDCSEVSIASVKYLRWNRQIAPQHDSRGEVKTLVDQYARLLADALDPGPRDREKAYLWSKDLVLDLVWAAIQVANTSGIREALEELDDASYLQRHAKKNHSSVQHPSQ
jgi:hypothetical protein